MKWYSLNILTNKIYNMCRKDFGSNDYSVSYSNLNKYGYSVTPKSFIELIAQI